MPQKMGQGSQKMVQDRSKRCEIDPRCSKMTPKLAKLAIRWLKIAPKFAKMAPRWLQEAPNMAKISPKRAQESPKKGPRAPQDDPYIDHVAADGPRWPQQGRRRQNNDMNILISSRNYQNTVCYEVFGPKRVAQKPVKAWEREAR